MVFDSEATNLVLSDWNFQPDIFVHDLTTGHTTRVSVDSNGLESDGISGWGPSTISANGRYVAFDSSATNLVANDTEGNKDVFVHDRMTRTTIRVSVSSQGFQGNNYSYYSDISEDGNVVAFRSTASNLVPNDTNGEWDTFVHDIPTGRTTRVSVDSAGLEANDSSLECRLSGDGRWVAFKSEASNLVPGDTNGAPDIFLHDRNTGITNRVSTRSVGSEGDFSSTQPSISSDGSLVGFVGRSMDLVPYDQNRHDDIFIHDRFGPTLQKFGLCPGGITLVVSSDAPGQAVAMFFGPAGSFVQATPPCQGVELGIGQPQFGGLAVTNSLGVAPFPFVAPPGACGLRVQAVDLNTCTTTNVMEL